MTSAEPLINLSDGAGRKILSRWMTALSRSDAGRDDAETGKQTKYSGPNKPFQHWLVRQKRHHGAGQEVDWPIAI